MNYIEIINPYIKALADEFKINDWLDNNYWRQQSFRYIIKEEQDFLINEIGIKKEKGIGINTPLKENIFLMFISIYAHIPLIIVGKPGISKSLSVQLFIKYIFDEQNDSYLLKNYPKINFILFKGSEMNTPEMIKNIFTEVENKMNTLLIFEHLDLLENNQNNCLEILNSKLEISLNDTDVTQN